MINQVNSFNVELYDTASVGSYTATSPDVNGDDNMDIIITQMIARYYVGLTSELLQQDLTAS